MVAQFIESPIVYMGSKRRLLGKLTQLFPGDVSNFYDIFGGSGTVSLNVYADTVHLNELSPHIYSLYHYFLNTDVRDIEEYNQQMLNKYGDGNSLNKEQYAHLRDVYNQDGCKDSALLQLLLRFSFLNMVRTNSQGLYNTSHNDTKERPGRSYYNKISGFQHRLKSNNVIISNKDFKDIDYSILTSQDFVYMDPPYLITEASYNKFWTEDDEVYLYQLLRELASRGVRFGLSNVIKAKGITNKYLEEFSKDFTVHYLDIQYNTYIGNQSLNKHNDEEMVEVYITNIKDSEGGISLF